MTLLCFPSNPLVIQGHKMFYELSICSMQFWNKDLYKALLHLPQIILLRAYCSVGSWETHSGKVYQEGPLGSTTVEDEGIRTGRRSGLPWILTKASNDPTGNSGAAVALQSSLKVRWEVKTLYSPSDKSSDSGLREKRLGGGGFGLGCSPQPRAIFGEGLSWSIQPAAYPSISVPRGETWAAYHSIHCGVIELTCVTSMTPHKIASCDMWGVYTWWVPGWLFFFSFTASSNFGQMQGLYIFFNCLSKWC